MGKIKSRPLQRGAKIGIVAPASPIPSEEVLDASVALLTRQGFRFILGQTVSPRMGYLAGNDGDRQNDLARMWQDESVDAIWCLRGGYGCLRLLNRIDYQCFVKTPKVFIGFSDITALELGLWAKLKMVTFHGPVLTNLHSNFSQQTAWKMISGEVKSGDVIKPVHPEDTIVVLRSGQAEGILLGGNLATLSSMIGTGYLPDFQNAILFIEEVEEAGYRIDRMLTQLVLNGILDNVKAVIIGRCIPIDGETEAELIAVFEEKLHGLRCPVGYGFPIGHLDEQWTVPQGIIVGVDMNRAGLMVLESPFESSES